MGKGKKEGGRVTPSAGEDSAEINGAFSRHKPKKQARRTLLPSLFPLHWQAHGIHATALRGMAIVNLEITKDASLFPSHDGREMRRAGAKAYKPVHQKLR